MSTNDAYLGPVADLDGLIAACAGGIRVVAFDVRGTLVDPKRDGSWAQTASNWGVPAPLALELGRAIPARVKERYRARTEVLDWTLVTAAELWAEILRTGLDVDACQMEQGVNAQRSAYANGAAPLVEDAQLRGIARAVIQAGASVVVVCDGNYCEQRALLLTLFPRSMDLVSHTFTSGEIGVNKLSPDFYARVAAQMGISADQMLVIGDRIDKDIEPARVAGCRTLLVTPLGGEQTIRPLREIIEARVSPRSPVGAVIGRFQPFHAEHLDYVMAAMDRSDHLLVGISNPFPAAFRESGGAQRVLAGSNPLPYWLRAAILQAVMRSLRVRSDAFTILPVALSPDLIRSSLPRPVEVFTTGSDEWSDEKERILRDKGFPVTRLYERSKGITGTQIRDLIRNDRPWRHLVPEVVGVEFGQVIEQLVRA